MVAGGMKTPKTVEVTTTGPEESTTMVRHVGTPISDATTTWVVCLPSFFVMESRTVEMGQMNGIVEQITILVICTRNSRWFEQKDFIMKRQIE